MNTATLAPSRFTTAQLRAALSKKFGARCYRITAAGEIHVLKTQGTLMRRSHWQLYAYTNAPELGLMLGLETL